MEESSEDDAEEERGGIFDMDPPVTRGPKTSGGGSELDAKARTMAVREFIDRMLRRSLIDMWEFVEAFAGKLDLDASDLYVNNGTRDSVPLFAQAQKCKTMEELVRAATVFLGPQLTRTLVSRSIAEQQNQAMLEASGRVEDMVFLQRIGDLTDDQLQLARNDEDEFFRLLYYMLPEKSGLVVLQPRYRGIMNTVRQRIASVTGMNDMQVKDLVRVDRGPRPNNEVRDLFVSLCAGELRSISGGSAYLGQVAVQQGGGRAQSQARAWMSANHRLRKAQAAETRISMRVCKRLYWSTVSPPALVALQRDIDAVAAEIETTQFDLAGVERAIRRGIKLEGRDLARERRVGRARLAELRERMEGLMADHVRWIRHNGHRTKVLRLAPATQLRTDLFIGLY